METVTKKGMVQKAALATATAKGAEVEQMQKAVGGAVAGKRAAAVEHARLLRGRKAVMKAGIQIQPPEMRVPIQTGAVRKAKRDLDIAVGMRDRAVDLRRQRHDMETGVQALGKKFELSPEAAAKLKEKVSAAKQTLPPPPSTAEVANLQARVKQAKEALAKATQEAPRRKIFAPEVEATRARKILAGQDVAATKTLPITQTAQEAAAAATAARLARAESIAAQTSPTASPDFVERAKELFGTTFAEQLPVGAGFIAKAKQQVGRTAQKLFGHGQNFATREVAGAKNMLGPGAHVSNAMASAKVAPAIKAIADDVAKTAGMDVAAVRARVRTMIESRGTVEGATKQFWQTDPAIQSIKDFTSKLTPEQSKKLNEVVQTAADMADAYKKAEKAARVPHSGYVTDPGGRILSPEAKAAQVPGKEFAGERATRTTYEFTDAAAKKSWAERAVAEGTTGHWETPDRYIALSSNAEQMAGLKALEKAGKAKSLGTHQISAEQWNAWRQMGSEAPGGHAFQKAYKGAQFAMDPAEAIAKRAEDHARQMGMGRLGQIVEDYSAQVTKEQARQTLFEHMVHGDDLLKHADIAGTPFASVAKDFIKGRIIPQPVADMVREAARISKSPKELEGLARLLNLPLQVWKPLALFAPGYTLRNLTQNRVGVMLQGGNPARMTKYGLQHGAVIRDAIYGKDLAGKFFTVAGQQVPAEEVVKFLRYNNLLQAGFTSMLLEPTSWQRAKSILGKAQRKFFEVNNLIETTDRVGAWLEFIEQGYSWRQAALKTTMAMPDLTDLTRFESGARSLMPWFSWMTHNTRNMARVLAERPQILPGSEHVRQAVQTALVGDKKIDEELRPEWMQEQQALQIAGDEKMGTVFLLASWLPFNDIMTILEGTNSPKEFAKGVLSAIRPDVKVFAELATGTDIFRQRPSAPFSTEELFTTLSVPKAILGRSGTALDNLLAIRPLREGARVALDMPTAGGKVSRALIGGAIQPLTRERALFERQQALNEEVKKLRSEISKAQRVGDNAYAQELAKRWAVKQAELVRLGLPGVAKSTQKSLQTAGVAAGAPAFGEQ
jgi:hypothetical protein